MLVGQRPQALGGHRPARRPAPTARRVRVATTSPVTPTWSPRSTSRASSRQLAGPSTRAVEQHLDASPAVLQRRRSRPAEVAQRARPGRRTDDHLARCGRRRQPGVLLAGPRRTSRCAGTATGYGSMPAGRAAGPASEADPLPAGAAARRRSAAARRRRVGAAGDRLGERHRAPSRAPAVAAPRRRDAWAAGRKPSAMPAASATRVSASAESKQRKRGSSAGRYLALDRYSDSAARTATANDQHRGRQPHHRPGADPRGRARTRRGTRRSSATRRATPRSRAASTSAGDHRTRSAPLSAVAVPAHQVQRQPVACPTARSDSSAAQPAVAVVGQHRDAVAVGRVAEPAQRHREAALGARRRASPRPAGRARPARSAVRSPCRRDRDRCSRPAAPGAPPAGPAAWSGPRG